MRDHSSRDIRALMDARGVSGAELGALRHRANRAARENGVAMWRPTVYAGLVLASTTLIVVGVSIVGSFNAAVLTGVVVGGAGVIASIATHEYVLQRLLTPYMRQLLEHGDRTLCRACGYNLIGSAQTDEWCPECGSYISHKLLHTDGSAPPLIVRSGARPSRKTLVSGVELEPALLEEIVTTVAAPLHRRFQTIYMVGFALTVTIALIAFVTASTMSLLTSGIVGGLAVAAFITWVMMQHRVRDRIIIRRVRTAICTRGIPICTACGRFRDPDQVADDAACPGCHADPPPAFLSPVS